MNFSVTWHEGPIEKVDIEEVAELFVKVDATFTDPWWYDVRGGGATAAIVNLSEEWYGHVIAKDENGTIIGFGAAAQPVENSVELSRIMTSPQHQRSGVGTAVITTLINHVEQQGHLPWVDVLETSKTAIRFYEELNFETVGYQYGRDSGRLARQMRRKEALKLNN